MTDVQRLNNISNSRPGSSAPRNIVFVGGPGTGETHLALAIASHGVKNRKRARFFSLIDLVNQLEQEKAAGHQGRLAQRLAHMHAIVLDKLGYLPFSANGGALLFHLLSKLYEKASLIVTTNLSFSEWGAVFGDAKMAHALFGLSKLAVWCIRLGIHIERIKPGHAEQNGPHERMQLTLKKEARKPATQNFLQQQAKFDDFIELQPPAPAPGARHEVSR